MSEAGASRWYVIWTHSHYEQRVCDQLAPRGFNIFLPRIQTWSRRAGSRQLAAVPMFPGYVFLRHSMTKTAYVDVCRTAGVVRLLGERWDRLAIVPEEEMSAIQRVLEARTPILPYPYLRDGQRVRIAVGPLADVEGILVRSKPNRGLLVVSVTMLRRSVAVEMDCTSVVAA